jgi:hypothetical protein
MWETSCSWKKGREQLTLTSKLLYYGHRSTPNVLQADGRMNWVNICFLVIDPQKHNKGCLSSCCSSEQWHLHGQYALLPKPTIGFYRFRRGWTRLHRTLAGGTSPPPNLVRQLLTAANMYTKNETCPSHSSIIEDSSLLARFMPCRLLNSYRRYEGSLSLLWGSCSAAQLF